MRARTRLAPRRHSLRRWLGLLAVLAVAACSPSGASLVTTSPAGAKPTAVTTAPGTTNPSPMESPAASAAPDANLEAVRLLDAQHGWVVASRRLLVTADGGSTWQDVTPPGGLGSGEDDYL